MWQKLSGASGKNDITKSKNGEMESKGKGDQ